MGMRWDDEWLPADICRDLRGDCGCRNHREDQDREENVAERQDWDGDREEAEGTERGDRSRRRRRHRSIRIGNVSVDCTPVTFRTPGQAVNIVSCPVTEVLSVPVSREVNVQVPLPNGRVVNWPITEQVMVPVTTTVNVPPLQIPYPTLPWSGSFGHPQGCGCGCGR